MATTVFQINLRAVMYTLTFAIATFPASADQDPCDGGATCRPGEGKLIAAVRDGICGATGTPSPYNESDEASYLKHEVEARNHTAIKRLNDEMETVKSESTTRAAYCSVKETADEDLGTLLDAGEGAMVTIVAGKERFLAHRAVLAARSPGFAAMLCHGKQEASNSEVAIPDVEGPVLRQLLSYLYTLQAPQLPSMAPQLLAAADKFALSSLKAECEVQVAAQLSVETAAATAVLAIRHSSTTLRQAAIAFIRAHLIHVTASQGWADAVRYQPDDFIELNRLLSEPPVETSTPATADTQPTTEATSLPHSSQTRRPVAAAPVSQPTTATPILRHTSHGQTPVAAASLSPPTSPPEEDAASSLRRLSSEEKGRRLIEAAKEGRVKDVEALLAAGADVGTREGDYRWTALHHAASLGHVEVASCLLQGGAQVDARNYIQRTPLHYAAGSGHVAVVWMLLASRADLNARSVDGWTPLHLAAYYGHAEVAAALLQAGADSGATNYWRKTPLYYARLNNHQPVIQLLT